MRTPTAKAFDALVLDARLRQSLVAVRSLGRRGLSIAALDVLNVPAFSSRWCRQGFVSPADDATDGYLAYLEQVLATSGARVFFPSPDAPLWFLRRPRH